jgi:hypothetical protein
LVGVAAVALFAMLASTAAAEGLVRQSKGRNGAKLKWLPYRPSAQSIRVAEQRSQHARSVRLASYQDGDEVNTLRPPARMAKQVDDNNSFSLPGYDPKPVEPAPTQPTPAQHQPVVQPEPNPTPAANPAGDLNRTPRSPSNYESYQDSTVREERKQGLFKHYNDCPSEHDFKPIDELTDRVAAASGDYPKECELPWKKYEPRDWNDTLFTWKASGLCHNPLYFEDVQLERYGHSWGPYIQPIISQGHFFVTVPILPYKMGLNPPRECIYSLGYYRPGNCAPYMIDPFPISVRAGMAETAAVLGAVYLVP